MLLEMHLRGLGVIDDAVVEFGPGLTVVTGETGAGKTMVVTGLGLLMGGRSDPGAVRDGYPNALVEGRVQVDPAGSAAARALDAGAELDDGDVLVISRSVSAEGRSRAHLGGVGVPVGTLIVLAGDLVAVHGQSDQIRLQSTARQRESLDRFAGAPVARALTAYRKTFGRLRAVQAQLTEITERSRERAQEAEGLRTGLAAIEKLAPEPGEDHALRAEAQRLSHAESLQQAAATANLLLSGDSEGRGGADVVGLVGEARRALENAGEHDPVLAQLGARAAEIGYLVDDLATECASYAASVESDPARLSAVEERRAALTQLVRGYGADVDEALEWAQRASIRLYELDGDGGALDELAAERDALRLTLGQQAAKLSQGRDAAAARLSKAVTAELQELSMIGAKLSVEVRRRDDPAGLPVDLGSGGLRSLAYGVDGVDDVEMLLAPHPGAPSRPLGKGASGGELSRVMLGLEVVLGAVDPVPTFVFDEVDAGVGGRAALGIGRRLARLARTSQVLVVTHLPQVAAFADHHLLVQKSGKGQITSSGVHTLDADGRIRELARMLGGVAESDSAQAHAEELLQLAESDRARPNLIPADPR